MRYSIEYFCDFLSCLIETFIFYEARFTSCWYWLWSAYTYQMYSFLYFSCKNFFCHFSKCSAFCESTITIKAISEYTFKTFWYNKYTTIWWNISTRYELKSMVAMSIFMDIRCYCIRFLEDNFGFPDTWHHKMAISFYSKYDFYSFFICICKICKKMIIFFCDKWKIRVFFTIFPSGRRYSFEEVILYYACHTFSWWSYDADNRNIRLRMEYMRTKRYTCFRMLITYYVSRYKRSHFYIS